MVKKVEKNSKSKIVKKIEIPVKINILLIGNGGREHALSLKILESTKCNKVFAIPGNILWKNVISKPEISINDHNQIIKFAKENNIKLVIIGPENALKNGLSDALTEQKITTFAPSKKAARIETDKNYSKQLMEKYHIPTAKYVSYTNFLKAKKYIETLKEHNYPIVIKSSNLAAGKGVMIIKNKDDALNYLNDLLNKNKYGNHNIAVIEEYLDGEEFSLMCLVNGDHIYPLPAIKDHKRINDNDQGLNTGGMGAISDLKFLNKKDIENAVNSCILPLTKGLMRDNINYLGVIFAGIMKNKNNEYKVIEYNARWGDPETEIVLEKINCDIIDFIFAVIKKAKFSYVENKEKIAGIVVCAKGYPEKYNKNIDLSFLNNENNIRFMGMDKVDGKLINNSGRIFMIIEKSLKENPASLIYERLNKMNLDKEIFHYRNDINWK